MKVPNKFKYCQYFWNVFIFQRYMLQVECQSIHYKLWLELCTIMTAINSIGIRTFSWCLNFKFFTDFLLLWIYLYMCLSHNCWVIMFSFFLPNSAFSESDITQESPFTSTDTGDSRSAFPSYTGTGISTEGSSDFSWGYGVSFMLLVWGSTWKIILGLGFISIFHSFTHFHCFFTF